MVGISSSGLLPIVALGEPVEAATAQDHFRQARLSLLPVLGLFP